MWLAVGKRSYASVASHRFLESHVVPKIMGHGKGNLSLMQFLNHGSDSGSSSQVS